MSWHHTEKTKQNLRQKALQQFKNGMPMVTKRKLSLALQGNQRTKGKHWILTSDAKEKHRQAALKQFKNGMPVETKKKISKIVRQQYDDPEYRKRISEKVKASMTLEVRKKMRLAHLNRTEYHFKKGNKLFVGNKNGRWCGGVSAIQYPKEWTSILTNSIRQRDQYKCQICNTKQTDKTLPVHHIDYDKLNCKSKNLITLCHNCHTIVHQNKVYWSKHLKQKVN